MRVNDRGPFVGNRVLDLSEGAMKAIGGTGTGVLKNASIEVVKAAPSSSRTPQAQPQARSPQSTAQAASPSPSAARNLPAPSSRGPTILPMAVPQQAAPQQSSAAVGNNDTVPSIDTTYPENFLALYSKLIYQIV